MPTEQAQQDQRSDARKRIDNYIEQRTRRRATSDDIHSYDIGSPTQAWLSTSDIQSVLAAADRDRQFVEAVREVLDDHEFVRFKEAALDDIDEAHHNIYGTPCTAKEKG